MKRIYLLQHSYVNESGKEEIKTLGIYSTQRQGEKAIERFKKREGFIEYPECYYLDNYILDKDYWEDGFVRC